MECFYYIKKMLPASGIELALSFAPVSALLNGGGVPVICSAPVSECWPELGVKSQDVLRRATVRRRCRLCTRLSSGEEDPAGELVLAHFPPVSTHLIGGGVPVICSPPVSECWPELGVKSKDVLRRAMVRRRCRLCARLSSGEESPTGVGLAQNIRRCMNLPRPSKSPR